MMARASGPFRNSRKAFDASSFVALLQEHRVLPDRRIESLRNLPARSVGDAEELRKGDEADLRVPGVDELERLGDAVALDDLTLQGVIDAERLHRLDRSGAVGSGGRVGDRDFRERARLQRLLALGHVDDLAPEHELADRIGEKAFPNRKAGVDGRLRPLLVGRQEHLERGVVGDLRQEGAGGAEAQNRVMAGLLLEQGGDLLGRLGEVGRDRDIGLAGFRLRCEHSQGCGKPDGQPS